MNDFKLYGPCKRCGRAKFFVRKATIPFPGNPNLTATSQDYLCGRCIRTVRAILSPKDDL